MTETKVTTRVNAKQVWQAVDALLSNVTMWTRGALAKTAQGAECDPRSPEAVCWCLDGAIIKVLSPEGDPIARGESIYQLIPNEVLKPAIACLYNLNSPNDIPDSWIVWGEGARSVYRFNDRSTFKEVKEKIACAIEKADMT